MTEEHKRKIGLANSISLKGKHCSPRTEFKKGRKKIWTEEEKEKISKKNSYLWKGGISRATAKKICIENEKDLSTCEICSFLNNETKGRTVIHHIDGNKKNNNIRNLHILCYFCHNAIHNNSNKGFQKGHIVSIETRNKISNANKGKMAWNKNMKVDRTKYANMGNFKNKPMENLNNGI